MGCTTIAPVDFSMGSGETRFKVSTSSQGEHWPLAYISQSRLFVTTDCITSSCTYI